MLELTVRLIFSLAVVIGLLLLIARFSARRFRSQGGAGIQVVHRQALTRTSSVSVVTIGGRVLVLGSTEQQINLLAELDPDELDLEIATDDVEPDPEPADDRVAQTLSPSLGLAILDSPRTVPVDLPQSRNPALGVRRGARKAPRRTASAARRPSTPQSEPQRSGGFLAGSILSPDTWRQALAAARRAS